MVSKCAGNSKEKSHKVSRWELCALQSNRAKCRGGGGLKAPPPVFLGLNFYKIQYFIVTSKYVLSSDSMNNVCGYLRIHLSSKGTSIMSSFHKGKMHRVVGYVEYQLREMENAHNDHYVTRGNICGIKQRSHRVGMWGAPKRMKMQLNSNVDLLYHNLCMNPAKKINKCHGWLHNYIR